MEWLAQLNDDDICDILPQLVQVNLGDNWDILFPPPICPKVVSGGLLADVCL